MKRSRFQLTLLIITLICLSTLVGIQVNRVLKEARLQEDQFNRNMKMALQRIENNLEKHSECPAMKEPSTCGLLLNTLKEVANLDSLIESDLAYYGINLNYEYGIVEVELDKYSETQRGEYLSNNLAEKLSESGFKLKIEFPSKSDFIFAQIGDAFISSIILIVLVAASFILIFRYYKRERSLSEQIRDFINNMTHEFKTPLTNISFANSMISKNDIIKKDKKLSSYTSIINTEYKKLNERVEQLLISPQDNDAMNSAKELIDLSALLENIIESFSEQIKNSNGNIVINKTGSNFMIQCNVDQFHIIFGNLIDNAIKYCTTSPKIEILINSSGKNIVIDVIDNGIGIAREHLDQIFKKYFRVPTKDIHDIKGFGIGLHHVKVIVEKHGGKIKVSSSKNTGSKFTIELPNCIK